MQGYRELLVWQKAMALVEVIYREAKSFPREETYGLAAQMRRAAVSIPCNIAEGHGRRSTKDYLRFVAIANGSLRELETQIEIAGRLGYWGKSVADALLGSADELARMLHSLGLSLRRKLP
jgi:four helix bundle protein